MRKLEGQCEFNSLKLEQVHDFFISSISKTLKGKFFLAVFGMDIENSKSSKNKQDTKPIISCK